jgi:hypothetical protein
MALGLQVVVDCSDPARLASFWAAALGYEMESPPEGFATWPEALEAWGVPESDWNSADAVVDPEGLGPRIFFQRVPEPKRVKNRLHLDVRVSPGPSTPIEEKQAAGVERMESLGATRLRDVEELRSYWMVMQDPEGNEFCADPAVRGGWTGPASRTSDPVLPSRVPPPGSHERRTAGASPALALDQPGRVRQSDSVARPRGAEERALPPEHDGHHRHHDLADQAEMEGLPADTQHVCLLPAIGPACRP